ncbi:hypothetical protein [Methylocella sp.]|uniref:hypothetical protein n=1 Tax=Methylocella sp. TaxID=1978226 RepID=UPI003784DC54
MSSALQSFRSGDVPLEIGLAALGDSSSAAPHPEEMKAGVELRIGRGFAMSASARTTPAGLICAAIAVSAILLSASALLRAASRRGST